MHPQPRQAERHAPTDADRTAAVAVKALRRVLAAWRVPGPDAARLAGVSERTWSRMKAESWSGTLDDDRLTRASALVGLYKALHLYFNDELADRWPRLPNRGPLFGGLSPVAHMRDGGLPAILATRDYVDALRGGS